MVDFVVQREAVLTQLIDTIERKNPRLGEVVRLGAIPRWLDRDVLAAVRAADDGLEEKILARLRQFSFVNEDATASALGYSEARLVYSREMRRFLLEHWRAEDLAGFVQANRRLAVYFKQQVEDLPKQDPRHGEARLAWLYHSLGADPAAGMKLLSELFEDTAAEYQLAAAEQLLGVANEQKDLFSPGDHALLDYLWARLDQLHERWEDSRRRLEKLMEQVELSPEMKATVRQALATTLLHQDEWIAAIQLLRDALTICEQYDLDREATRVMVGMGDAYLDFALSSWAEGPVFETRSSWFVRSISNLVALISRLPLILYLVISLKAPDLLVAFYRIGQDMDWVVARLFAEALGWYRRAGARLQSAPDASLLLSVEENTARLYLYLNHPARAELLYKSVLARGSEQLGGYRVARLQLELAMALVRIGKLEEARHILTQILNVFASYGHRRRVAQTQTLLAQVDRLDGRLPEAAQAYLKALPLWESLDDREACTDLAHEMETLARMPELDPQLRSQLASAAGRITLRSYATRYTHPLSMLFSRIFLVALALVFFFTLVLGIRTESGATVVASATLIRPVQQEIPAKEELSPMVALTIEQQIRPTLQPEVFTSVIAGTVTGYLLLYAVLGIYIILRAQLTDVQKAQRRRLVVDLPTGLRRTVDETDIDRLDWDQVDGLLVADRAVWRVPWLPYSYFALFGETTRIVVPGLTRHYRALQELVRSRLPERASVHRLGFTMLKDRSGWIFLLSLAYLLVFGLLAKFNPDLLIRRFPPVPYALADLFGLSFLGIAFPLGYWFGVQPVRSLLMEEPRSLAVWIVGGVGFLFGALSILQINLVRMSLGRPDIAVGLLAIGFTALAAYYVARLRTTVAWGGGYGGGEPVYSARVRMLTALAATIIIAGTLLSVGRELYSFHFLVLGNARLQQAELASSADPEHATEFYKAAVQAFQRSTRVRPEAGAYNSLGATLSQLKRYEEAIAAYQEAARLDPNEPIYTSNIALSYTDWALDEKDLAIKQQYYIQAWDYFAQALEQMETNPQKYQAQMERIRLLRAGASFERGKYFHDEIKDFETALKHYRSAFEDYSWVIEHGAAPVTRAAAYAGRGWVYFWFGRLDSDTVAEERDFYKRALADFEEAKRLNPGELSAFTGMGWANYYTGLTYPGCTSADDPEGAMRGEFMTKAANAYAQVIQLQPEGAIHYRVKAQLDWILRTCPGYEYVEQLQVAIQDYQGAIQRNPTKAHWYFRQGNMYWDLGGRLKDVDPEKSQQAYENAAQDYVAAIRLNPDNPAYWNILRDTYRRLGQDDDQVFTLVAEVKGLDLNQAETYIQIGKVAAANSQYAAIGAAAFKIAAELDPTNYDAQWLQGKAYFDAGRREQAVEPLTRAHELQPTNPDPLWLLGWAYFILGKNDQALEAAHQFADVVPPDYPKRFDRYYLLAQLYQRLNDKANALRYAELALDEVPSYAHFAKLAGIFRDFASPLLVDAADRAIALKRDDPQPYFWRGLGYLFQDDPDAARASYSQGLEIARGLGDADLRRQRLQEAVDDLQTASDRGVVPYTASQELLDELRAALTS